jgi:uncharacterized protein YggE
MNLKKTLAMGAISTLLATLIVTPTYAATGELMMMPVAPVQPTPVVNAEQNLITVYGYGKYAAKADRATISVALETNATSAREANQKLRSAVADVAKSLEKYGIDPSDISTSYWNFFPTYDYTSEPAKVNGYTASRSLEIVMKQNIDKVSEALDSINTADTVRVTSSSVSYTLTDTTKAANEARLAAVKDARARATFLAEQFGVKLGSIHKVEDYYTPTNYYYGANGAESVNIELTLTATYSFAR